MGNPPYYGTGISFLERRLQEPPCEPSRPSDASVPPVYKCSIINEIDSSIDSLVISTLNYNILVTQLAKCGGAITGLPAPARVV
jgi:hypothetical protein